MNMFLPDQKEALLPLIREKLGEGPLDFTEKWRCIRDNNRSGIRLGAAGVLLLIYDRPSAAVEGNSPQDLVFQLIKRSARVPQGGDISCPGGFLSPVVDRGLACLTSLGIIPAMKGQTRGYARKRPDNAYRIINLFLANAIRESWEEIRLNPFNIDFLGPLPTYSLTMFQRTIFPLVACVKRPWQFRPNQEVDKVVEIPLRHFFEERHYAWFSIDSTYRGDDDPHRHFPCYVVQNGSGVPDILWGATFNIIQVFLKIIFDFRLPAIPEDRLFTRVLTSEYVTGRQEGPPGRS